MLCFMRSFEIHLFETETDIDLAISGGIVTPERVDKTECIECSELVGHADYENGFEPFVLVIDVNDVDWTLCTDCASPIIDYSDILNSTGEIDVLSSDDLDFF